MIAIGYLDLQNPANGVKPLLYWMMIEMIINFCFFFELICDLCSAGSIAKSYKKFRLWPETFC